MIQYVLLLANVAVIVLGGIAVSVCFKGYRENHSVSMLCLTIGFLLIAAGSVTGMVLLAFSGLSVWEIQSIESVLIAFGFGYVVHSMFTKRR